MWLFNLHSLFHEYGWQFLKRVALRHPVKTVKALLDSSALDISGDMAAVTPEGHDFVFDTNRSIIGVGFCLKPISPSCVSGRANHDCYYLEHLSHLSLQDAPHCCRECKIREIGEMTLKIGASFYIMTSAKDILLDVFVPALKKRRFSSGLFVLCRYSFKPFALGLLTSGLQGLLFPFQKGDCRDYKTWLYADRGIKEQRTEINESSRKMIEELLGGKEKYRISDIQIEKKGNVLSFDKPVPDTTKS